MTIDCPSNCPYLIASRQYDRERRDIDWSKLPFAEVKVPPSFARDHNRLLGALTYAVSLYAGANPGLVDSDALAAFTALAESFQTLASGIYYERPPTSSVSGGLYQALKSAIEDFRKAEAAESGSRATRDAEVRDALIFFTQLGATRTNGRPKGRAFLDLLRSQVKSEELSKPASNIILMP